MRRLRARRAQRSKCRRKSRWLTMLVGEREAGVKACIVHSADLAGNWRAAGGLALTRRAPGPTSWQRVGNHLPRREHTSLPMASARRSQLK